MPVGRPFFLATNYPSTTPAARARTAREYIATPVCAWPRCHATATRGSQRTARAKIVTCELECAGSQLYLNADATRDSIAVGIQECDSLQVPGFELARCRPMHADSVHGIVAWKGQPNLAALVGRKVRLRLRLQRSIVYALEFP